MSTGSEIIRGLEGLRDALSRDDRLETRYTVRTVELSIEPPTFSPDDVRSLRKRLSASQAVFAALLGVKAATIQSWEQGKSTPPPWGRRLLELMQNDPRPWRLLLEAGVRRKQAADDD